MQTIEGGALKEEKDPYFFFPEALENFTGFIGSDWVSAIMDQIMVASRMDGIGRDRIIGFSQSESAL